MRPPEPGKTSHFEIPRGACSTSTFQTVTIVSHRSDTLVSSITLDGCDQPLRVFIRLASSSIISIVSRPVD